MSTFGTLFQVNTFGESHCRSVGCIVQGVPPRLQLTEHDIQKQLNRRRPGQSNLTTQRNEKDKVIILSGIEHGLTLGTPISLIVNNEDQRPHDYGSMNDIPRPSHADYTYQMKYGIRASSGGGRASARETIGRVAAGAIAEKWLFERFQTSIIAYVSSVHNIQAPKNLETTITSREQVDINDVRCPDQEIANKMTELIKLAKSRNDSIGGIVTCIIYNCPIGIGEPVFDKLEAKLAHAMLSIPATKGFEIGSGFDGTTLFGSEHNDMFIANNSNNTTNHTIQQQNNNPSSISYQTNNLSTSTNHSGGIQGGITNGEPIIIRIAFKPPATIGLHQETSDFQGIKSTLKAEGRHDPCVVPRAVPIVEAMAAITIADYALIQSSRIQASIPYPVLGRVQPQSTSSTSTTVNNN